MNEANLEWQWQQYLKRVKLNEKTMPGRQRVEMKRAFYGACGQMLVFFRDDLYALEDESIQIALMEISDQVMKFWTEEIKRHNARKF